MKNKNQIQLSEEKIRNLVKDLNIGLILQGSSTEILMSNPKALELLGISEEQLLGKTSFDSGWNVIHEDGSNFPSSTHPVPIAVATKKPVRDVVMGVYRPITKDRVWLLVDAEPEIGDDGSVQEVVCMFIDITQRIQLKEKLVIAKRFSQSVVDSLSSEISIIDESGTIIEVNSEWRKFSIANSLVPIDLCEGGNYFTVCDAAVGSDKYYADAMSAGIRSVINGEQHKFCLEYPCDSLTEKRWFNAIVTRLNEEVPTRLTIAHENITERKIIQINLALNSKELALTKLIADEKSEFAENIINTIRDPLIALDHNLRVVKASSSFYKSFKVTPKETIGTLIYELGNNQWDIPKLKELLETILPENTSFENFEVTHDFSLLGERIMLLNARQIIVESGKGKIILLAIEDITERKQIDKKLEYLNNELRELSKHLQIIIEAERSTIAKEVHDELAQNLVALTMNASFLKGKLTKKENQKIIDEQIKIANGLINTSRTLFNSLHPAMLDELGLEDAIKWYAKAKLEFSGITFKINTNIEEEKISKEISLGLFRIFQECLTNVLFHSKATEVFVDINRDGQTVIMKFQDNGSGFDKNNIDTTIHHGLLEIRERVYAMNGGLSIKSVINKGTTLNIIIPFN